MGPRQRKGVSLENALIFIVLFSIVIVILVVIYNQLYGIGKGQFTEKECQTSLLLTKGLASLRPTCAVAVPTPIPLKCNRDFITITDASVTVNGKDATRNYDASCPASCAGSLTSGGGTFGGAGASCSWGGSSGTPSAAGTGGAAPSGNACLPQSAVAEEMRSCWREFFSGEQIVFQQVDISAAKFWKVKDYRQACFICGEVVINTTADVNGFVDYLKSQAMPDSNNMAYYDYLAKEPKAWCDPSLAQDAGTCWDTMAKGYDSSWLNPIDHDRPAATPSTLTKGQKYLVTFIRRGLSSCDTTPNAQNAVTHQYLTNVVELVPADKIGNMCDVVLA